MACPIGGGGGGGGGDGTRTRHPSTRHLPNCPGPVQCIQAAASTTTTRVGLKLHWNSHILVAFVHHQQQQIRH
ncbi:hypothetical protein TYRP_004561 [Tyrophagus putrescentiae]|nr:hypothetical protein TYRP_004561 [Tyrophagus putrescentiae]